MSLNTTQLPAFSRLFSSAVFRELATKGKSPTFTRLIRKIELPVPPSAAVKDAFETAFEVLKQTGSRDEYVYKAALTHRVLLGKHNLRTACMLNEFRTGECKADVAILNGTTTVYEIKSERDSLSRLSRQIENYKRVFASVLVVAGENHVETVLKATSPDVGVLSLSKRYQVTTRREAQNRPDRICPATVFDSLRTSEAKDILRLLNIPLPTVPNTLLHRELRILFKDLQPEAVHTAMLKTLKKSRSMSTLESVVSMLPPSLQPAALSFPFLKKEHDRLLLAIDTPMEDAMEWA